MDTIIENTRKLTVRSGSHASTNGMVTASHTNTKMDTASFIMLTMQFGWSMYLVEVTPPTLLESVEFHPQIRWSRNEGKRIFCFIAFQPADSWRSRRSICAKAGLMPSGVGASSCEKRVFRAFLGSTVAVAGRSSAMLTCPGTVAKAVDASNQAASGVIFGEEADSEESIDWCAETQATGCEQVTNCWLIVFNFFDSFIFFSFSMPISARNCTSCSTKLFRIFAHSAACDSNNVSSYSAIRVRDRLASFLATSSAKF
mmetsp:Transcript_65055/g.187188  ORF Transcript_65055/g.187188 Transcript_65055/m.187188 type:complete len:257 (-) Transcript_65055:215-985(-)